MDLESIVLLVGLCAGTYVVAIAVLALFLHWIRPPCSVSVEPSKRRHHVSAVLRQSGHIAHFQRVDLRREDYEEELARAVADMKQQARAVNAAARIAVER